MNRTQAKDKSNMAGIIVAIAVGSVAVLVLARSMPDLVRYLRIRRM